MAATIRAVGSNATGTTSATPGLPSGTVDGDLLVCIAASAGSATEPTMTGDWTKIRTVKNGTALTDSMLTVWYHTGSATSVSRAISSTVNHVSARIIGIAAGTFNPDNPINVESGGNVQGSTTSVSISGLTTTVDDCLILSIAGASLPDANSTAQFDSWTNASLASITEETDNNTNAGNGGGHGSASGVKTTAGAVSATTATKASEALMANLMVAIEPFVPNEPPTVALNSPANEATVTTPNPTFDFTGTDAEGEDIRFNVQIQKDSIPREFAEDTNTLLLSIDEYHSNNRDSTQNLNGDSGQKSGIGQSFTGNGEVLKRAIFFVKRIGSPTGNVVAKVYAHSGTFGTNGVPTGSALATSTTRDITTLGTSYAYRAFIFDGTFTPVDGTKYFIVLEFSGGSAGVGLDVGYDDSSPTHAGNGATFDVTAGTWSSISGDVTFYLYHFGDDPSFAGMDAIVEDNNYVYVGYGGTPAAVLKIEKSTFTVVDIFHLGTGEIDIPCMLIDDTYLYFSTFATDPGKIFRLRLDDFSTLSTITATGWASLWQMAQDNDYVYVNAQDSATYEFNHILKISKSSFTIIDDALMVGGYKFIEDIDGDDDYIYATYDATVARLLKSDFSTVDTFTLDSGDSAESIGVDDTHIYVGGDAAGVAGIIYKILKSNFTTYSKANLIGTNVGTPSSWSIFIDKDYVYIPFDASSTTNGRIYAVKKSDLTSAVLSDLPVQRITSITASQADYLYATTQDNSRVIKVSKYPLLNKISGTDSGFANPDVGGDTDPFTSGDNIQFTVQSGDELDYTTTYFWRVRGKDPAGSNTWGDWSEVREFTVVESVGDDINDDRDAEVLGADTSDNHRSGEVAGQDTAGNLRAAEIRGEDNATDIRDVEVSAQDTDADERSAEINGANESAEDRAAEMAGFADVFVVRESEVLGADTDSDIRDSEIKGFAVVDDSRSAELFGEDTAQTSRGSELTGSETAENDREAELFAEVSIDAIRSGEVYGEATADDVRTAEIEGANGQDDTRNSELYGIDIVHNGRESEITGAEYASADRIAEMDTQGKSTAFRTAEIAVDGGEGSRRVSETSGIDTTEDVRQGEVKAAASSEDSRAAEMQGSDMVTAERAAQIVGSDIDDADRSATIEGSIKATNSRTVELGGIDVLVDARIAEIVGSLTFIDEREVEIDVSNKTSSYRGAGILGGVARVYPYSKRQSPYSKRNSPYSKRPSPYTPLR
jgi:hypothetical protein